MRPLPPTPHRAPARIKLSALKASAVYWQEAAALAHRMTVGSHGMHKCFWQSNARFAHQQQANVMDLILRGKYQDDQVCNSLHRRQRCKPRACA